MLIVLFTCSSRNDAIWYMIPFLENPLFGGLITVETLCWVCQSIAFKVNLISSDVGHWTRTMDGMLFGFSWLPLELWYQLIASDELLVSAWWIHSICPGLPRFESSPDRSFQMSLSRSLEFFSLEISMMLLIILPIIIEWRTIVETQFRTRISAHCGHVWKYKFSV